MHKGRRTRRIEGDRETLAFPLENFSLTFFLIFESFIKFKLFSIDNQISNVLSFGIVPWKCKLDPGSGFSIKTRGGCGNVLSFLNRFISWKVSERPSVFAQRHQ